MTEETPEQILAEDARKFREALAAAAEAATLAMNVRVRAEDAALYAAHARGDQRERECILARRWKGRE
jgi:hypothetical protein